MKYLLDSDITSYLIRSFPKVTARFTEAVARRDTFVLLPMVHYEVTRYLKLRRSWKMLRFYGRLSARWRRVEVEPEDWDTAADLWADRHRAGRPIEDADLLIAVAALRAGAVLITNNGDHFAGLGVAVENWADDDQPAGC